MKGIILAAGKGQRLGSATPKCLHQIGAHTILQRQLNALHSAGATQIVCVVGYEQQTVMNAVNQAWPGKVTFVENPDYGSTNTSYSLYLARAQMDQDFFYMNADVVFRADLLTRLMDCASGDASLGIIAKDCCEEEVKVIVESDRIVEIGKHLAPEKCLGEFIGVALFRKSMSKPFCQALEELIEQKHRKNDYFEAALNLITAKTNMMAVNITSIPATEIDFRQDLDHALANHGTFDLVPPNPKETMETNAEKQE